ncbi:MAG: tetratricopeptide repeat protein [Candidatus Eremiobacterota bacterium]
MVKITKFFLLFLILLIYSGETVYPQNLEESFSGKFKSKNSSGDSVGGDMFITINYETGLVTGSIGNAVYSSYEIPISASHMATLSGNISGTYDKYTGKINAAISGRVDWPYEYKGKLDTFKIDWAGKLEGVLYQNNDIEKTIEANWYGGKKDNVMKGQMKLYNHLSNCFVKLIRGIATLNNFGIVPDKLYPIEMGGIVKTAEDTRVTLIYEDHSVFTIRSNSTVEVQTYKIKIEQGGVYVEFKKTGRSFQLITPSSAIGVLGTKFFVNVENNGNTSVYVTEGKVSFSDLNKKKSIVIEAGCMSTVSPGKLPSNVQAFKPGEPEKIFEGKNQVTSQPVDNTNSTGITTNDFDAWNNKGNALYKLKKYEEAIKCYDKALEIDPDYAYAWFNKGNALNRLEKDEEAIKCYDKALEIDPNNANAWFCKGLALKDLKKYEEAIKCYDKVLELDPENIFVEIYRKDALKAIGR